MPSTYRILMVSGTLLLAVATLLYTVVIAAIMNPSNRPLPLKHNSPRAPSSRTKFLGDACDVGSTANATVLEPLDLSTTDWQVYCAFASRYVLTPRNVQLISSSARADIANEVGLAFHVAARVFKLCHSYVKSFNRCQYRLLSDPGPCSGDGAAISVIVVHSLPESTKRRINIRARLNQLLLTGYRLVFLLGRSESVQSETKVQKEAAVHGDIIWADFFEDYHNLTIKTLVMLRWMEKNCMSANYLVKADDDVYLNMSNLNAVLSAHVNRTRIIVGIIGYGEGAYRYADEKWYMPMYMFSGDTYPPFAYGPSYVISTDLLEDLNRASLIINYIHLEDIFIAVCASMLTNVHHVHVPSFISGNCSVPNAVALHGLACR